MRILIRMRVLEAAPARFITTCMIVGICLLHARVDAAVSWVTDDRELTSEEISRIVDPIERFSNAGNVQFQVVARLDESCGRHDCTRERDAALQRLQRELDTLGYLHPAIAEAVAAQRLFVEANATSPDRSGSRVSVELLSKPLTISESCPFEVKVSGEAVTASSGNRALSLQAGSQAVLRVGTPVEVKSGSNRSSSSLLIEPAAMKFAKGKRTIGADGLLFNMPSNAVRLSLVPDVSKVIDDRAQPKALGDVILEMQAGRQSGSQCEWRLVPASQ